MVFRYSVSLFLATVLFWANAIPAAEAGTAEIEAGPIWSNEHAQERCPEAARQWTEENPGFRAEWTGHWNTTVPGEMSVCLCDIAAEEPEPVEIIDDVDVPGRDLRSRRGYSHAWINEAENVSVLYFLFDNGVLRFYRDESNMGHVFMLDLSGLSDVEDLAEEIVFEDIDDDGYADVKIPLPDGRFAAWRWNAEEWTFEATAESALLPKSAATRKTLAALPAWTTAHSIVHAGELSELASRLGNSWLVDCTLDIKPERKGVLEWLRSFPMESFSLVKGLSRDDEDIFQGAIRFAEEKEDLLARLEDFPFPDEDAKSAAEAKLTGLFYQLSGIPKSLVGEDGIRLRAGFVEDKEGLFSLLVVSNLFGQWLMMDEVFVSVADGDGEKLLIVASSPEENERARDALDDESARLEIVRRNPEKANFVQVVDDASGNATRDMVDGMYWDFEPKTSAGMELSLGLSENGVELSLWHTFLDVVLGDSFRPEGDWRAEDAGFSFGGGNPWLAGALSPTLSEKNWMDLLALSAHGNDELVRETLEKIGVDLSAISGAFRSLGVVLGGNASVHGEWMPGGYVFVSGDAEKMRALAPVLKLLLYSKLSHSFEAADREGWDVFYVLNEDYRERARGMPWFAGVKDGVLMMGIVEEDDLESAPDIDWRENGGEESVLLAGQLDFHRLVEQCRLFLDTMPLSSAYEAALAVDMEELFRPSVWSAAFKFFAAVQEIEGISLTMPDQNRVEMTIRTQPVDYEQVWELMRTSRMLARED